MTGQSSPSINFWPLVDAVCDGVLDATQSQELATLLDSDLALCQAFADHIQLRTDIGLLCRAERASDGGLARVMETMPQASPSIALLGGHASYGTVGYTLQTWSLAYLVAAAVFLIGLCIGSYVHVSQPEKVASTNHVSQPLAPSVPDVKPEFAGRITGMVDCRGVVWTEDSGQWSVLTARQINNQQSAINNQQSTINDQQYLVPLGAKYRLTSGLLEITYDTGARVILQGPITYEVESVSSGFLSRGRLTARVDNKGAKGERTANPTLSPTEREPTASLALRPSAKDKETKKDKETRRQGDKETSGQWSVASGQSINNQQSTINNLPSPLSPSPRLPLFFVRTPTTVVTDLGTEFGVEVTPEGHTDTQVFEGSVQVVASAAGVKDAAGWKRICRKGEAVRVEAGTSAIRPIAPEQAVAKRYVRVLPTRAAASEEQIYAQFVLSLNPVIYYRMEQPRSKDARRYIFDSGPGGLHGQVGRVDPLGLSPYRPGRFGDSLDLRACGGVVAPDYPVASVDQLAVSAWLMVTGERHRCMIAGKKSNNAKGLFYFGLLFGEGDLGALAMLPDGRAAQVRDDAPLSMSVWHHVAMVADKLALHLYRDGNEVASSPFGDGSDAGGKAAKPDLKTAKAPSGQTSETRVDELAIFNRPLSPQTIHQLFQGPQQASPPTKERR